MQKSKIIFKDNFKEISLDAQLSFLIYDKDLLKYSSEFKTWQKKYKFQYAVQAGEKLKSLSNFESHVNHILSLSQGMNTRKMQFVVIGGGSVGDFGGFIASIFKRGVGLVHIPSTWLAAIDSAHGGKTALNVRSAKNQIGTFYVSQKIFIIKSLLDAQPIERASEACGEMIKIALIDGGSWTKKLAQETDVREVFKRFLKPAIAAKYTIVDQDPFEKSGIRQTLNLGHTWGHVVESSHALPHGTAVLAGLQFCLRWSFYLKILKLSELQRAESFFNLLTLPEIKNLSRSDAVKFLRQDKKKSNGNKLSFIFLKSVGQPIQLKVSVDEILIEAKRQGWLKL